MTTQLQDGFGRSIDYLRMSVTDRCDFRCVYCMAEDMTFLPRQQVLGLEELYRLACCRRPHHREQFLREIAPRLDTDNIFVADAEPYTQMQAQFEVLYGDTDKVNSQTIVVLFLLGNVFLGLIGTSPRTRRRRSEIALRLAMGSTKQQVFFPSYG